MYIETFKNLSHRQQQPPSPNPQGFKMCKEVLGSKFLAFRTKKIISFPQLRQFLYSLSSWVTPRIHHKTLLSDTGAVFSSLFQTLEIDSIS